jgi:DNA (cytosine-5)-methyltransferase 1
MRPIGIDLFAGAGGMSLGFEQAGFDVVAAAEVDPIHCAVHKFNFPETAVIARSVVGLSAGEIRLASGIGNRQVHCVFGGPPCQGFSLIGSRALDDPRNRLVLEFVRIVAELDALTFVFENVKGLTLGKQSLILDELVQAFDNAGYTVQTPWRVLNAANFGTPQNRERLILMGSKKGMTLPVYPTISTHAAGQKKVGSLDIPLSPNVEDALGDLPDASTFTDLEGHDTVLTNRYRVPSAYAAEMRCITNEAWHYGYVRNWKPEEMTSSARTCHTEISQRRFESTLQGKIEPISRFFKLSPTGIANTLRAGTDGARGAFTSPRPIHYKYPRCITVREMARLHGFPDWFRLQATKWHGARQIGNAVPAPLARAVGLEVMKALGKTPKRPEQTVQLGDPSLLYLDMSQAANYFGVVPLSGKRDQKSGARKRKQNEIEAELMALRVANG